MEETLISRQLKHTEWWRKIKELKYYCSSYNCQVMNILVKEKDKEEKKSKIGRRIYAVV